MRYSDDNQQGLMSLLAASQAGLDPTTAYSMLQDIQSQQMAQNQMRQERQAGLIGLLTENAMAGMPYGGAEAMMEAAPGPMGPALESALAALYPNGGPQTTPTNASGAAMDFPNGSRPTQTGLTPAMGPEGAQMQYQVPVSGPMSTSPTFQPPQPSITESLALQEAELETAQAEALRTDLTMAQAEASRARAEQWTVEDYIAKSQQQNPELWANAPEEMMAIVENTFGAGAVEMRGIAPAV